MRAEPALLLLRCDVRGRAGDCACHVCPDKRRLHTPLFAATDARSVNSTSTLFVAQTMSTMDRDRAILVRRQMCAL